MKKATDDRNHNHRNGYASINELNMYYEIHGAGSPMVLLHGSLTTIDTSFGKFLPDLEKARKLVAVEQQGHGRTADIDRPLTYEQMVEDTIEFLRQLKIEICTEEDKERMQAYLIRKMNLQRILLLKSWKRLNWKDY